MDDQVVIVDEFTGRLMPGRSWRLGLHQAVEAKEGISISQPSENLAQLSFQRFFRVCSRLSGITGTASEAANEFWSIYELPLITVPPHRPCVREVWPTPVFFAERRRQVGGDRGADREIAASRKGLPRSWWGPGAWRRASTSAELLSAQGLVSSRF